MELKPHSNGMNRDRSCKAQSRRSRLAVALFSAISCACLIAPLFAEESHMAPGGMTHPSNIVTGPVTAIRRYAASVKVRIRSMPNKEPVILISKQTPILADQRKIKFNKFKTKIMVGDELSIKYTTNIAHDWVAQSIVILKAKKFDLGDNPSDEHLSKKRRKRSSKKSGKK